MSYSHLNKEGKLNFLLQELYPLVQKSILTYETIASQVVLNAPHIKGYFYFLNNRWIKAANFMKTI